MENTMEKRTDAQSIINAGKVLAEPRRAQAGGVPHVVIPEGDQIMTIEDHLLQPVRRRGTIKIEREQDFICLVNEQKTETTRLFARVTRDGGDCTAVINFHGVSDASAGHGDYRIIYTMPFSEQFKLWSNSSNQMFPRLVFAELIEENIDDILEPEGAELLDLVRELKGTKRYKVANAVDEQNGDITLDMEQKTETHTQKGKVTVPATITLGVPIFKDGEMVKLTAKLKYHLDEKEGGFRLGVKLLRPHLSIEKALNGILTRIARDTSIRPVVGSV